MVHSSSPLPIVDLTEKYQRQRHQFPHHKHHLHLHHHHHRHHQERHQQSQGESVENTNPSQRHQSSLNSSDVHPNVRLAPASFPSDEGFDEEEGDTKLESDTDTVVTSNTITYRLSAAAATTTAAVTAPPLAAVVRARPENTTPSTVHCKKEQFIRSESSHQSKLQPSSRSRHPSKSQIHQQKHEGQHTSTRPHNKKRSSIYERSLQKQKEKEFKVKALREELFKENCTFQPVTTRYAQRLRRSKSLSDNTPRLTNQQAVKPSPKLSVFDRLYPGGLQRQRSSNCSIELQSPPDIRRLDFDKQPSELTPLKSNTALSFFPTTALEKRHPSSHRHRLDKRFDNLFAKGEEELARQETCKFEQKMIAETALTDRNDENVMRGGTGVAVLAGAKGRNSQRHRHGTTTCTSRQEESLRSFVPPVKTITCKMVSSTTGSYREARKSHFIMEPIKNRKSPPPKMSNAVTPAAGAASLPKEICIPQPNGNDDNITDSNNMNKPKFTFHTPPKRKKERKSDAYDDHDDACMDFMLVSPLREFILNENVDPKDTFDTPFNTPFENITNDEHVEDDDTEYGSV